MYFFPVGLSAFQLTSNFQGIETSNKAFRTVNSVDSLAVRTQEKESPTCQARSPEHLKCFSEWQVRGIGRVWKPAYEQ